MLKRYTRVKIIFIIFSVIISISSYGQNFYTQDENFPQAQFRSTSSMHTTYKLPELRSDGMAIYPRHNSSRRTPSCGDPNCTCGENCNCGDLAVGEDCPCTPIGEIDIITIFLIFGMYFLMTYLRNKQNSEIQIQNTLNLKDNKL